LAAVHVLNGIVNTLFVLFDENDKKSAADERMDLLEMEIMRILSGEYTIQVRPENIMLSSSVRSVKKRGVSSEDTENYADDEGETEESETKED